MIKRVLKFLAVAGFVVISCGSACAGVIGAGPKVGTPGLGGDLTVRMFSNLNFRVGYNGFNYSHDYILNEADLNAKLTLQTVPFLLDWHPSKTGGFRFSAGAIMNNNKMELFAKPNDTVKLNGIEFSVDSLDGDITFNKWAGYLGLGYGNAVAPDSNISFACDFGVMFHGKPRLRAEAHAQDSAVQELLNESLQKEVADAQATANKFQIYPVISLGFTVTF